MLNLLILMWVRAWNWLNREHWIWLLFTVTWTELCQKIFIPLFPKFKEVFNHRHRVSFILNCDWECTSVAKYARDYVFKSHQGSRNLCVLRCFRNLSGKLRIHFCYGKEIWRNFQPWASPELNKRHLVPLVGIEPTTPYVRNGSLERSASGLTKIWDHLSLLPMSSLTASNRRVHRPQEAVAKTHINL